MVDPEIGAKIYPWIFYKHKRYTGIEAARILTERQMQGLEMLTAARILCKVNSVMIPGINDKHLVEVNRAVKSRGAFLHNIMPLISAPEHGTVFGLNGQRGPTAQELKALQDACEGEMNMMRHCRQCRADAVGLLGEDRSAEFTTDEDRCDGGHVRLPEPARPTSKRLSGSARPAVAAKAAEQETALRLGGCTGNQRCWSRWPPRATADQRALWPRHGVPGLRGQHAKGAKFVGHRRVDLYCQGGYGEEESLVTVIRAINDCHAVFVAKIGGCPKDDLKKAGIDPVDKYAHQFIEQSAITYFMEYVTKVKAGEIIHQVRGDADIRQGAYIAAA